MRHTTYDMRHAILTCRILAIAIFAAVTTSVCAESPVNRASQKVYTVSNVIDGDTVDITNGPRIRYIGINTPETMDKKNGRWVLSPEAYAREARDLNVKLVQGKKIKLEFDETKKDKYGRVLAYVYADDKMVNAEMVRQGLATTYTFPPNIKYLDILVEAQDEARRNRRGLWEQVKVIEPAEAKDHIKEVQIVKGTVTQVRPSYGRLLFTFASDKENPFSAIIFETSIPVFERKGINPAKDYTGKTVSITGKIESRSMGPRMVIDNPAMIHVEE